jgi:hypothetical protein
MIIIVIIKRHIYIYTCNIDYFILNIKTTKKKTHTYTNIKSLVGTKNYIQKYIQ